MVPPACSVLGTVILVVMDRQRIRVAVVGTGAWWGREHARVFSSRPDVELCAVVGRSVERTRARAGEFGVDGYVDIGEMLERERPDLVSLCLPNEGHVLLREAAARSLFFGINFNHRYARPVVLAADAVRAGRLGELMFATWRFGGDPGTSSHAHANLIETQCHGLDMLEHLCGPIESVMAQMTDKAGRGWSTLAVSLRFAGGAVGSLVGSYDSSYAYPETHRVELNGTDGRVVIQDTVRRFTFTRAGSEVSEVWQAGYFNDADRDFHRTFDRHVDAMVSAFRNGEEPPVHARAGRRALALALAIIRSFETGTRVHTAPVAPP